MMKLISIEMNNFRQYYGEGNIINFNKNNSNITVIIGENGAGKTSIFRAMIFALFGISELEEDSKNEKVHLVNLHKLEENMNKKVEASVKVNFEHEGKKYLIERKTYSLMKNNKEVISSPDTDVSLKIIDENGILQNREITDNDEILSILEKILNPKLKDFFFFNGEKIEELAKTDAKSRKTIKEGIIKLLQIDNLELAIKILDKMLNEQIRKIKESSSSDLVKKYNEKEENEKDIEKLNNEIDRQEDEIETAKEEIEEITQKMKKNEGVKKYISQKEYAVNLKNEHKNNLRSKQEELKKLLQSSIGNLIIEKTIIDAEYHLKNENEEIDIPEVLIDKILREKQCICGRHFEDGSATLELFKSYKINHVQSPKLFEEWKNAIIYSKAKIDGKKQELSEILSSIAEIKEKIDEQTTKIERYTEEIKQFNLSSESELKEYQQSLEKLESKKKSIETEKTLNLYKKISLQRKVEEIQEDINRLEILSEKNRKEVKKKQYIENVKNMLVSIKKTYTDKVKKQLAEEMFKIYKKMISEKDRDLVSKIEVDDEYRIDLKNWQSISILQDISAGQKQIISLALIIALSKLACNENNTINVPLFMDTPFGRISGENRKNIINTIPNEMEQWILLATDTELTKDEKEYLYATNKWHNLYELEQSEIGKTKIKNIDNIEGYLIKGD